MCSAFQALLPSPDVPHAPGQNSYPLDVTVLSDTPAVPQRAVSKMPLRIQRRKNDNGI